MRLLKQCKIEHNLAIDCQTIKLGTLEDYRLKYEGPHDLINDKQEGKGDISDILGNVWKNAKPANNCYIFCCSMHADGEAIRNDTTSLDYNSHFFINDPVVFNNHIAALLQSNITLDDIDEQYKERVARSVGFLHWPEFKVIPEEGAIDYVKVKDFQFDHVKNYDHKKYLFSKPQKYHVQKEYRFAFLLFHYKIGYIPVKREPKILNSNLLKNFVSPH